VTVPQRLVRIAGLIDPHRRQDLGVDPLTQAGERVAGPGRRVDGHVGRVGLGQPALLIEVDEAGADRAVDVDAVDGVRGPPGQREVTAHRAHLGPDHQRQDGQPPEPTEIRREVEAGDRDHERGEHPVQRDVGVASLVEGMGRVTGQRHQINAGRGRDGRHAGHAELLEDQLGETVVGQDGRAEHPRGVAGAAGLGPGCRRRRLPARSWLRREVFPDVRHLSAVLQ
jgi:hypothetical protein